MLFLDESNFWCSVRNNIVIFISKKWYDCRKMKDMVRGETGYKERVQLDSNWSQHGFFEFGRTTDFF